MQAGAVRDVATLVVPRVGWVVERAGGRVPVRVVDAAGQEVPAVSDFLREMAACDASPTTLRSYGYELLGWLRFLAAVEITWDRATRAEARDYALWLAQAHQPYRRRRSDSPATGRSTCSTTRCGRGCDRWDPPRINPRRPGGSRERSRTSGSTNCLPHGPRIGTGRC